MTDRISPVFLSDRKAPSYYLKGETPSPHDTARSIANALALINSNKERSEVTLSVDGRVIPGVLFTTTEGAHLVVTDGFMCFVTKENRVDLIMPFTYFVRR